jgi:predicted dehydrogenase
MKRRTFLQVVGTAGAGAVTADFARGAPALPARGPRLRVAVVGCGRWASAMAEVAQQSGSARIVALVDPLLSRAAALRNVAKEKSRWQHVFVQDDLETALYRSLPEAVILGVPEHWSLESLRLCAQRNIPVLTRAPLAHCISDLDSASLLASRSRVSIALPADYDPGLAELRARIMEGAIGAPRSARITALIAGGKRETPSTPVPPARDLNWEKWCGPAGPSPYLPTLTQPSLPFAGWRWHLRYGSGPMGSAAPHWFAALATLLPLTHPSSIYSIGRRVVLGSPLKTLSSDAPDHQIVCLRLPELEVTWEHRLLGPRDTNTPIAHAVVCGEHGLVHLCADGTWTISGSVSANGRWLGPFNEAEVNSAVWTKFLANVRTPKARPRQLVDFQIATNWVVWSMAAYQSGRTLVWDGRNFT